MRCGINFLWKFVEHGNVSWIGCRFSSSLPSSDKLKASQREIIRHPTMDAQNPPKLVIINGK